MRRKSPLVAALAGLLLGAGFVGPAFAEDCGCGGPKSYYAKKYGTVKPPEFTLETGTAAPLPSPTLAPDAAAVPAGTATPAGTAATQPVNPPATGSGG